MTIFYPLNMPVTIKPATFSIQLEKAVSVTESEFTFSQQVQEHQGEAWEINVGFELLNRDQAEAYNAFLLKLAGRVGTFLTSVAGSEKPRGVATGVPLVKGANQTGRSLVIDGFTNDTVAILKEGDFIQLGSGASSRLHKVLDTVDSDGTGTVTVDLAPKIINAPADNSSVVVENAKGLFRLKSNAIPVTISSPNQHSVSFRAREVR